MGVLITFIGILVVLVALAGLALGLFMAVDRHTREPGLLFALWWTPALAAAAGIFMRDPVTFLVGLLCFVAAGVALYLGERSTRKPPNMRRGSPDSERTTQQMIRTKDRASDRTAS